MKTTPLLLYYPVMYSFSAVPSRIRFFYMMVLYHLCVICLVLTTRSSSGFILPQTFSKRDCYCRQSSQLSYPGSVLLRASINNDYDNEDEDSFNDMDLSNLEQTGPEKSQMNNYISKFLQRENKQSSPQNRNSHNSNISENKEEESSAEENEKQYTHLIAVPMGNCHELSIELESVQRAILYHCPVLVHACLVPAVTRLPLLYVHAPQSTTKQATESLQKIVQEVVQRHIYVAGDTYTETIDETGEVALDGTNEEGYRPLVLTFQSLEIDGFNNQALHTVALPDDPGTRRLQTLVMDLQNEISTRLNWETSLPPDEHIVADHGTNQPSVFRPRVPFMRIPPNFHQYLDPLPEGRDDEAFRTSDEGGNGISPIFWCSWWDDVFGTARCREIAIYPRSSHADNNGLAEDSFHIPYEMTDLPNGNTRLTQQEARFQKYQDQRMKQAEYDNEKDVQERKNLAESSNTMQEEDPMLEKTRVRLESLYQQDLNAAGSSTLEQDIIEQEKDPNRPKVDTSILDDWTQERIRKANEARGITTYDENNEEGDNMTEKDSVTGRHRSTREDNYAVAGTAAESSASEDMKSNKDGDNDPQDDLDDWTKERIRKAVESRQFVQSRAQLSKRKEKAPITDNPVFQKYKNGTLVPDSKRRDDFVEQELPPFPARDHFLGFWKVFSSPTGFPPDEEGDGSKSENLILRVDGTTAGGPILDPETKQKAAGGTWKVTANNDEDELGSATLRIRLVIPPKKDRILVMEGRAIKRSMASLKDLPSMTSSTFGIPELEEKIKKAKEADESLSLAEEEMVHCSGKVWLEDAVTKKNKMEIGTFSLMKLNTPRDPSQYTITIPRPIRNQD